MTKQELNTLKELLTKLREQRIQEYEDEGYLTSLFGEEELYELDDGDNLLQNIDSILSVVETLRGN